MLCAISATVTAGVRCSCAFLWSDTPASTQHEHEFCAHAMLKSGVHDTIHVFHLHHENRTCVPARRNEGSSHTVFGYIEQSFWYGSGNSYGSTIVECIASNKVNHHVDLTLFGTVPVHKEPTNMFSKNVKSYPPIRGI